jgi:acyl-CoA thioesterase-1
MIVPRGLIAGLIVLSTFLFAPGAHSQSALVVALGDSNTAGYGVGRENAFPARLQAMLRSNGYDVRVANAGISGDTVRNSLPVWTATSPRGRGS